MKYYIGIDLGGTNTVSGVVNDQYKIVGVGKVKTKTKATSDEIINGMVESVHLAVKDAGITLDQIEWIGVGTPGIANFDTGYVEYSCNLAFDHTPVADILEEKLGKKTFIANDADAAAYGEFVAGAARGTKDAIAVTLGTGVGGGVIINGKIRNGFNHAGGELGHMGIVYNGRQCTCGRKGCLETYASATGLINLTKEAMQENPDSKMWDIAGSLENVDGRTAFDAMRANDETGKKVVDDYINYLVYGLTSFVNIFQPEVLCIGGGICKEGETLLAPLRKIIRKESYGADKVENTRVVVAELGNDAGIIGAAFLGKMKNDN